MMQAQFDRHLKNRFPFMRGKKILLAISGGIDSVVLAVLCKNAHLDFAMAHCNFHLRGKESDGDEAFVENLANEWGIEVFVQPFDTEKYARENKISIQVAARELRYEWFQNLATELGFDYIFTAHHADDNLETFLIHTIRGTGLEGLTGIPERNENILRPLLIFSRKDIHDFAESEEISWREDSSNASKKYLRNKIRHDVLPVLKAENSQLLETFANTQKYLQEASGLLKEYTGILYDEIIEEIDRELHFDIEKIQEKSTPKAVLYQLLKPFGFTEWENVYDLLLAQSGKMVFSATHRLVKDRGKLILTENPLETSEEQEIQIPYEVRDVVFPLGKLTIFEAEKFQKSTQNEIYVDKNTIKFPLKLRKWKNGDYFYPFGMTGRKKVSAFLKDEKFSLTEKEKIWVLLSGNEIMWIVGQRADDRFKVEPNSAQILKIIFTKNQLTERK